MSSRDVGHYGVFNGRRFREEIYPRVRDFIRRIEAGSRRGAIATRSTPIRACANG